MSEEVSGNTPAEFKSGTQAPDTVGSVEWTIRAHGLDNHPIQPWYFPIPLGTRDIGDMSPAPSEVLGQICEPLLMSTDRPRVDAVIDDGDALAGEIIGFWQRLQGCPLNMVASGRWTIGVRRMKG